jgi:putative tryptophan/tyrosine transport system substrate-binding protein
MGAVASSTSYPWALRAQQPNSPRRLGILMPLAESEEEPQAWISELLENLQKLGWRKNNNLSVDVRWAGGDAAKLRGFAAELSASQNHVLVVNGTPALSALRENSKVHPNNFRAGC